MTREPTVRPIVVAALYAAAALAFVSAAFTAYWVGGGDALLSTVGGQFVRLAERGGPGVWALGLLVVGAKITAGLLALAVARGWGDLRFQRRARRLATVGGVLLAGYGGLLVVVGALVLARVIEPSGYVDRTALRWHVAVWDMWFLLWGLLLSSAFLLRRRHP